MSASSASLASRQQERRNPGTPDDMPDVEKQVPPEAAKPAGSPASSGDLYQPKSLKFWVTLLCNFLALFLVALDRTIIATAIPRITDEFHSLGDVGWYAAAYMLATSASQLLFGRIYKFYHIKWTYLICIVVFEIGSAICGAAPNSPILIVGRAIAGLASAGIFSGCMMVMIPMIPLHKRPMFQGFFGMVFGIASVLGPVISGGFTGHITWRWCFYINLPIGAVTLGFMSFFWNPPHKKHEAASVLTHFKRLDPLGTFLYVPAVVCLLLALQWGGSTYAWSNGRIIALFVLFGVLLIAFGAVQALNPETATIPARVITQRSIFCATLFTLFLAGSMMMTVYYLPMWFQTVKGVEPLRSGIYTIPIVLSLVVASAVSGFTTQKIGYYVPAMIFCPVFMAIGQGLMGTFKPSTGSPHWIGFQFVVGFGLGFGMQTGGLAAQTVLPAGDISTGVSIIFFAQQLGGAIFTAVGQSVLSNLLVSRLAHIPGLDPAAIIKGGVTELSSAVPPQFAGVVVGAYNYACTRIFLTGMGVTLCALLAALGMQWRSIKKGRQLPGGLGGPGAAEVPAAKEPASQAPVGEETEGTRGGEEKSTATSEEV